MSRPSDVAWFVLGLSACQSGAPFTPDAGTGEFDVPPVGSTIIHSAPGLPFGDYVVIASNPGIIKGSRVTAYEQVHRGYPVPGFGYFVTTKDGISRGKTGEYLEGLPNEWPKPMSESAALALAVQELNLGSTPPWAAQPQRFHAPKGTLGWVSRGSHANPKDFVLSWGFDMHGTGVGLLSITLDAVTGKLISKQSGIIQ